jgi:hypothetical protein
MGDGEHGQQARVGVEAMAHKGGSKIGRVSRVAPTSGMMVTQDDRRWR